MSDREIGIQWDKRGMIYTIDRQGERGERFTRPPESHVLWNDDSLDNVIDLYTTDMSRVIEDWA